MALNWDLREVKDSKTLCYEDWLDEKGKTEVNPETGKNFTKLKPLTDILIWITMVVDMGDVTEHNWREFFIRLDILQQDTPWLRDDKGEAVLITPEEVKAHIGLHCNVTYKTWEQWMEKRCKLYREEMGRHKGNICRDNKWDDVADEMYMRDMYSEYLEEFGPKPDFYAFVQLVNENPEVSWGEMHDSHNR